ncbi:MAG: transporter [Gammaproteobacteria bacterium HGW-Gammaproteobacteria-11]|nr:MAG: transporter [Gammaproteobacteria bacterium HGW-Gammaproteobacteria-11]
MSTLRQFFTVLLLSFSLLGLAACSVTSGQKSPGEFVDDSLITTQVKAAFVRDSEIRAFEINVETYKGVVQLSGFVSSSSSASRAVAIARQVNGVKAVRNDMQIR